jgi:quinolinate synthase
MSDNVAVEFPDVEFVRPCNLCPHMKRISLDNIIESLEKLQHPVEVRPDLAERARRSVERMLEVGRGDSRERKRVAVTA